MRSFALAGLLATTSYAAVEGEMSDKRDLTLYSGDEGYTFMNQYYFKDDGEMRFHNNFTLTVDTSVATFYANGKYSMKVDYKTATDSEFKDYIMSTKSSA